MGLDAGRDVFVEPHLTLDGDDGAAADPGQPLGGLRDLIGDPLVTHGREQPPRSAQMGERRPQFRMEDDENGNRAVLEDEAQEVRDHPELEHVGERIRHHQDHEAEQDANCTSPLEEQQDAVQDEAHQRHFDDVAPARMQQSEMLEAVHPR